MTELITSSQNPRVKQALRLRKRRERDATQRFLIEGYRELLRALAGKQALEILFVCKKLFLGSNEQKLIDDARSRGAQVLECSESVFEKLSYRDRPDGLLATAPIQSRTLTELTLSPTPLVLVAEAIEKPGNLGTILRSADAAGADAVIVCDRCTDVYNPNVVRASTGTLFTQPVVQCSSEECVSWLRKHKIRIAAATPHATQSYTSAPMSGSLAIAVGTEQLGLSDLWMQQADLQVRIPMYGEADSLNVATATTLMLFEARRQQEELQGHGRS